MIDPVDFGKAMGGIVNDAIAPILKRLESLESRQAEPGPAGEKGDPGKDGEPVAIPDVVSELLGTEELATLVSLQVAEAVKEWFDANPVLHGNDGADGAPGRDGEPGPQGEKGDPGQDAVGIADLMIDRDGNLVATFEDGRMKSLGVIVGKDGTPGRDGADGLSMSEVTRQYDPEAHEVVERWTVAGEAKELRYPAGGLRPGGFWRDGMKAAACQTITHDGALWIAKRDTSAKPCIENSEDWQLAARKGRDGRDGRDGKPPPGPVKLKDESDD